MSKDEELAGVNLGIYATALYPLYMLVKYCAHREETGLNKEELPADDVSESGK
jgi:hypothetical protein